MKLTSGLVAVLLSGVFCNVVRAEAWAERMFSRLHYDFGSVPKGSDVRAEFVITNPYTSPVVITGLRRTCGCTDVALDGKMILSKDITQADLDHVINPGQQSKLIVTLDTLKYEHEKSTTVIVSFQGLGRPEARLTVRSYIRRDVVCNPGAVQFGAISRNEIQKKKVKVEYAGTLDWRIEKIEVPTPHLDVSCKELYREEGRVGYELLVAPKETAPAASFSDVLRIYTNDPVTPVMPLIVEGTLTSNLVVTPSRLELNVQQPTDQVTKIVLMSSKTPFRILAVEGTDEQWQAKFSEEAKKVHVVTLKFQGNTQTHSNLKSLQIKTDVPGEPPAEIEASVTVLR